MILRRLLIKSNISILDISIYQTDIYFLICNGDMKYAANIKMYLMRKQQYKQIVKLLNSVTSREIYAKVAYFISVTIHRCRKYINLQNNQEHCKWDIWINEVNINNTVLVTLSEYHWLDQNSGICCEQYQQELKKSLGNHGNHMGGGGKTPSIKIRIENHTSCWTN